MELTLMGNESIITLHDEMANIYYRSLNPGFGAPPKYARLVIGDVIIKHTLG